MKLKNLLYTTLLCLTGTLASCSNEDIDAFDNGKSYIYFDVPYQLDAFGNATTFRSDSISYSFALDELSITNTTLNVVVKVIGTPVDYDRPYDIELISDQTNAISTAWDESILNNRSIKAGELTDTIRMVISREPELQERWMQVCMRILPNDNFRLGYGNLETVKVSFSDILSEPSWWSSWANVFGPFYREVYLKWIEIYYEGADTTTSLEHGAPLWWGNMPSTSTYLNWYPVMNMYVTQLREYFEVNDVYPDGDTSVPPIKLP